jgi:hypothetical protein
VINKITVQDIEQITEFKLSDECQNMINNLNMSYCELTQSERDQVILDIIKILFEDNLVKVGKHRFETWEKGWFENLELLKQGLDPATLIPKYFGKYNIVRWKGNFIKGNSQYLDYYQIITLVDAYLHEYVGTKFDNLFEFGCGPAYHLLRFGNFNPNINLVGLDWTKSSQNIIQEINNLGINTKITGHNFDFYNPDYTIDIPDNSAMFTVNALEQVGKNYEEFINFILDKKPDLCINFEPIPELLDKTNLIDQLCILYSEKRNYLQGYLDYLEQLEKENKIEIILKKRLYSGSLYLEGYPVIIWKPKK